jgi:hypothetical protein
MQLNAFSNPGRFYKGNLHLHSTRSDGTMSPEEVIAAYRDRGYDFVSLTDHFLYESHFRKDAPLGSFIDVSDTRHLRGGDFTTILGAELHGPAMENGELWHFVAAGLPADFLQLQEGETGIEVARRASDHGAWVALAHPAWNAVSVNDALQLTTFIDAIETYNHSCSLGVDRAEGWYMLDLMLQRGHRLNACATDDAHFKDPGTPDGFGGWVNVKAGSNDPDALLAALKAGAYYSSTGAEIHDVRIEGDVLTVETSPAARILLTGNGAKSRRISGNGLTRAELELDHFSEHGWVRLTVIAADGARAWTNPIWLDAIA